MRWTPCSTRRCNISTWGEGEARHEQRCDPPLDRIAGLSQHHRVAGQSAERRIRQGWRRHLPRDGQLAGAPTRPDHAAERALHGLTLSRGAWLFVGPAP